MPLTPEQLDRLPQALVKWLLSNQETLLSRLTALMNRLTTQQKESLYTLIRQDLADDVAKTKTNLDNQLTNLVP